MKRKIDITKSVSRGKVSLEIDWQWKVFVFIGFFKNRTFFTRRFHTFACLNFDKYHIFIDSIKGIWWRKRYHCGWHYSITNKVLCGFADWLTRRQYIPYKWQAPAKIFKVPPHPKPKNLEQARRCCHKIIQALY